MRKVNIEQYGSYAEQYVEGQHTAVWVICRAVWGGSTLNRMGHAKWCGSYAEQYGKGQHRTVWGGSA